MAAASASAALDAPRATATAAPVLLRNTGWNLAGEAAPMVAALVAIPILIRELGTVRFGVFTVMWTVFTSFGGFDLGLSSATTKFIAERAAVGRRFEARALFWTSLAFTAALGLLSACGLAAASGWLTHRFLSIPPGLRAESRSAFLLLALGLPVIITASVLRGTLAAYQRFDIINKTRMPTGSFFFLGPVLVLPFSHSLVWMVAIQILGRAATWAIYFFCCLSLLPPSAPVRRPFIKSLLRFGGWLAVFNLCGSLLTYADRLIAGALLPMGELAWLATAQEIASRAWFIPGAVMSVTMPALTEQLALGIDASRLLKRATALLVAVLFPLTLGAVVFARQGLLLWVGAEFAAHATQALRWCVIGALLMSGVPAACFALTQAAHRPDLGAKTRLVELFAYIPVVFVLCKLYGVNGAAAAYALRVSGEGAAWLAYAGRLAPAASTYLRNLMVVLTTLGGTMIMVSRMMSSLEIELVFYLFALAIFAPWLWRFVLTNDDRRALSGAIYLWKKA